MPKRTKAEIGCGFLDQHDLWLLNNNRFVVGLATNIVGIWDHVVYHWKG